MIKQFNDENTRLINKIAHGEKIYNLTTMEKISIYTLNGIMVTLGYLTYPEASKETLLMIFPGPKKRIIYSDFGLGSKKIMEKLKNIYHTYKKNPAKKIFKTKVVWYGSDYLFGKQEARYGLALNICHLSVKVRKRSSKNIYELSYSVNVAYGKKMKAPLLYIPIIKKHLFIEGGLYWALQELEWLHPYVAVYKCNISEDELKKRLEKIKIISRKKSNYE